MRDWNQLWHLLIVYSCCITATPGFARDAPASVSYPPTPKKNVPLSQKRGWELKTRFEDYFTEQLKLLLLHSVCCRSLRIAAKPSFQCLIWNPTEMNCQFWFHAQVCFSSFKSCVPTNAPTPCRNTPMERQIDRSHRCEKQNNNKKVLMFTVLKITQIYF